MSEFASHGTEFSSHVSEFTPPVNEFTPPASQFNSPVNEFAPPASQSAPVERELFARHATRDGHSVVRLRAIDRGGSCVVEAEVFPPGALTAERRGPYTFADAGQATMFVNEAVESLLYLGCDVFAQ